MNLQKIKYSKCPSCKKYGIRAFFKSGRYTYKLTCKYCKKKFKINIALNTLVTLTIAIVLASIFYYLKKNFVEIPLWVGGVFAAILLLIFDYFAPLEEMDDKS